MTQSDRPAPLTLADSSAWIEFFRNTGSLVCLRLPELLRAENVAICDAVRMEILAGARDDSQLATITRALDQAMAIPTQSSDYDDSAILYRRCRQRGETVRKLLDCLIAAVAIRAESLSCTTTGISTYWPGSLNCKLTALKVDAGKVVVYPRRRAQESRSATVRLNTGAPGRESRSTQK